MSTQNLGTIQFLEVNAVHDGMSLREVAEGHRTGE
jgi:hypothetical protein